MSRVLTTDFLSRLASILMLSVILMAMVFRAAIPAGYMLDERHDGVFAMVICTANGQETIMVDKNLQPVDIQNHDTSHDDMNDGNGICEFAVHTYYTATIDAPHMTSQLVLYGVLTLPSDIASSVYITFFGNHAARAPPINYV